jgi:hypothetical protein
MPADYAAIKKSDFDFGLKSLQNIESLTEPFQKALSNECPEYAVDSHPIFDTWGVTRHGLPTTRVTLQWIDLAEFNCGRRSISEMVLLFLNELRQSRK